MIKCDYDLCRGVFNQGIEDSALWAKNMLQILSNRIQSLGVKTLDKSKCNGHKADKNKITAITQNIL